MRILYNTLEMWKKHYENSMGNYAIFDKNLTLYSSNIERLKCDLQESMITAFDKNGVPCDLYESSEKLALIQLDRTIIPVKTRPIYENNSHTLCGLSAEEITLSELFDGEYISKENVSEIRQNVSAITANSGIVRTSLESKELYDECRYISEISSSCFNILSGITNSEILNSLFFDAGRNTPTNVSTLIKSIVDISRFNFTDHLTINTEIEPDIILDIDNEQFISTVINLIVNGYSYNISENKTINITLRCDGDTAHLTIDDNGVGIGHDEATQMFRGKQPNSFGKEGLGLAIVRLFAKIHGGEVSIVNKGNGSGSTVRLSLPVCKNAEAYAECSIKNLSENRFSTLYLVLNKAKLPVRK